MLRRSRSRWPLTVVVEQCLAQGGAIINDMQAWMWHAGPRPRVFVPRCGTRGDQPETQTQSCHDFISALSSLPLQEHLLSTVAVSFRDHSATTLFPRHLRYNRSPGIWSGSNIIRKHTSFPSLQGCIPPSQGIVIECNTNPYASYTCNTCTSGGLSVASLNTEMATDTPLLSLLPVP